MWIPPLIPLFLALVLIPEPGVSQQGGQHVLCSDCKQIIKKDISTEQLNGIKRDVVKYVKCPPSFENIRFQFKVRSICAQEHLPWVKQLTEWLDGDRKCLSDTCSNSQKEYSKGTNEKPFTTTTNTPTTAPVTTIKPSTQSWGHNIGQSTEPAKPGTAMATASPVAPRDLNTTPLDSKNANINLAQGKDKSIEHENAEDKQSKEKNMQIAIISLILIVLTLVAVVVGIYCRKKKSNQFNTPCGSRPVGYTAASSEDSIIEVNAEQ